MEKIIQLMSFRNFRNQGKNKQDMCPEMGKCKNTPILTTKF